MKSIDALKVETGLQDGAQLLDFSPSNETVEYEKQILVDVISAFMESGGGLTEVTVLDQQPTTVVVMHEAPNFMRTYPYNSPHKIGKTLVIVDHDSEVSPDKIASHITLDDLAATTYLFPEHGVTLSSTGLSGALEIDSSVADIIHEMTGKPHYDLELAKRGLLGKAKLKRLAKQVNRQLTDRTTKPMDKSTDSQPARPLRESYWEQHEEEKKRAKVVREKIETIYLERADDLLSLNEEELKERLAAMQKQFAILKDDETDRIIQALPALIKRINNPALKPEKRQRLRRELGKELSFIGGIKRQ